MEDGKTSESHLTSAVAFVEGGIQDPCDDACSICLEEFCDSDPSTLTTCKHEFHLQCILEWCQRSSQCPMCWQSISLKDPSSQELLDGVKHERNIRMNPPRNTTIFHHPTLGDFELQHLPVSGTESEFEERIIQHLAAAAAMGRARQLARREGQRNRSSAQGRPHFVVFSTDSNGSSSTPSHSIVRRDGNGPRHAVVIDGPNSPFLSVGEDLEQLVSQPSLAQADQLVATENGSIAGVNQRVTSSTNRRSPTQTSSSSQDSAGPSDFQAFSETVKSRFSALSTRYKESITKNTRGWKERLFARNNSSSDEPIVEAPREVDQRTTTTTVSRMVDLLQLTEDGETNVTNVSHNSENMSTQDPNEQQMRQTGGGLSMNDTVGPQAPCTNTSSASN